VRCIEHGHLADDPTAQLMAETETWWSLQPFLDDEDAHVIPDPAGRAKQLQVTAGTDRSYQLARKHGVKVAWGSDILFDASLAARQGRQLAKMTRWYTPAEVLVSATSGNAEPLALCGPAIPIPAGSASSNRAPWPICSWSTVTRSPTSTCWPTPTAPSWSS
jgi:imidazolonepropionase-like amidohydrolase